MTCCPLQLTAGGGKRWMGQTLKWRLAQSTDGRPRWREQKNIYNQRDLTKGETAIRKTIGSSIGGVSEEKKKNSSSDEARERTLTPSSTTPLTILFHRWRSSHQGPVLKPISLPNSLHWACWVWLCSHLQWETPPNWDPTTVICKERETIKKIKKYNLK